MIRRRSPVRLLLGLVVVSLLGIASVLIPLMATSASAAVLSSDSRMDPARSPTAYNYDDSRQLSARAQSSSETQASADPGRHVVAVVDQGQRRSVAAAVFATEEAAGASTPVGKELTTYYLSNRGFLGASAKQTLEAGTRIDRYGGEGGFFASPEGTPVTMRALRPGTDLTNLHAYEVVSPFDVDAGTAAPWFGQLGLGTQYELPSSVADRVC